MTDSGNSLSILVSEANEVVTALTAADRDAATLATDLRDRLTELLDGYERVLAAHGLPLPYQRDRSQQ